MTEDLIKSMRENVEKSRELVKGCRENQPIVIDHDEATRIAEKWRKPIIEADRYEAILAQSYLALKAENEKLNENVARLVLLQVNPESKKMVDLLHELQNEKENLCMHVRRLCSHGQVKPEAPSVIKLALRYLEKIGGLGSPLREETK